MSTFSDLADAATEPWVWPKEPKVIKNSDGEYEIEPDPNVKISLETQANAYEALFQVFWNRPWFKGAYLWKWHPINIEKLSDAVKLDQRQPLFVFFSPQFTPAMDIIKKWYGASLTHGSKR